MNKQILVLLFLLIISSYGYTQDFSNTNEYIDYAITQDNDTIYGSVYYNYIRVKGERIQKKRFDYYEFKKIKLKEFKEFKRNERTFINTEFDNSYDSLTKRKKKLIDLKIEPHDIFKPVVLDSLIVNSIGSFINLEKRQKDYIISNRDTTYGTFKESYFITSNLKFYNESGENVKQNKVNEYRFNNRKYKRLNVKKRYLNKKNHPFLQVIYEGNKLELYRLKVYGNVIPGGDTQIDFYYFIKRKGESELTYILKSRFDSIISKLISDKPKLIEKVRNKIYTYNDLYLIVKHYNMIGE